MKQQADLFAAPEHEKQLLPQGLCITTSSAVTLSPNSHMVNALIFFKSLLILTILYKNYKLPSSPPPSLMLFSTLPFCVCVALFYETLFK